MLVKLIVILTVFRVSQCSFSSGDVQNVLDLLFLTSEDVLNAKCRNNSAFYRSELDKFTEWAVEMFDSSAKIPTGVIYGSTYHLGNFDQCLNVDVPLEELNGDQGFSGKYCLPTITFKIPENVTLDNRIPNTFYPVWNKLWAYSKDQRRRPRNKLRWAVCVPSTCTEDDLVNHLNSILSKYGNIEVKLEPNSCQIKGDEVPYNDLEKIFLVLVFCLSFFVFCATFYEMFTDRQEHSKAVCHQILISFSLVSNIVKLFTVKPDPHNLEVVHGLRFWGMFFTIMAHQFMYFFPPMNAEHVENFYQYKLGAAWLNGPILIDVFFVITGFLASYFLLDELLKKKRLNYLVICVHRVIRLIPLYIFVIMFYSTLFIRITSGPIWKEKMIEQKENCLQNWWINLLYLNNYFNVNNLCLDQSWYIAANMQLFFISPLVVIWLHKNPKFTIKLVSSVIAIGTLITFFQILYTGLDAVVLVFKTNEGVSKDESFAKIYVPTHNRVSPYMIGMLGGYFKYIMRAKNMRVPRNLVTMGWVFLSSSMLGGMFLGHIFYQDNRPYYRLESALFGSLHHVFIALSILWFIFAIPDRKGLYMSGFLTPWPFVPLSRLTYAVYLCHLVVQMYIQNSKRQSDYISVSGFLWHFWGDLVWTYVLGFLLSMFIETPFNNLEHIVTGKGIQSYVIQRRMNRKAEKEKAKDTHKS